MEILLFMYLIISYCLIQLFILYLSSSNCLYYLWKDKAILKEEVFELKKKAHSLLSCLKRISLYVGLKWQFVCLISFNVRRQGNSVRNVIEIMITHELQKREWRPQKKLLLIVMYQVFYNQWSNLSTLYNVAFSRSQGISRYLNCTGDVPIKN